MVAGATGLVGAHLVEALAADPTVLRVTALVRRPTDRWAGVAKVTPALVDLLALDPARVSGDQLFVCLGTTLRKAGSREAFREVDHDAVLACARAALAGGVRDLLAVSSTGADPGARSFYLGVKGQAEEALSSLPFRSVHLFRPSILTGERAESRPAERAGIVLGSLMAPLMVGPARRYRPIAGATVARAMARVAADPGEGIRVHESEEIAVLGA